MVEKKTRVIRTASTQVASSLFDAYEGNIVKVTYNREKGTWWFTVNRPAKEWEM